SVALADLVAGEAEALAAVAGEHLAEAAQVADRLALADLEDDVVGPAPGGAEEQQHLVDVVNRVEQRRCADVDEEQRTLGEAAGVPDRDLAAEPVEVA